MKRILKYCLIMAVSVSAFALSGCHHKNETLSTYMEGTLTVPIPAYSLPGKEYTVGAGGITNPSSGVTYQWTFGYKKDTLKGAEGLLYTFIVPDTLATFSLVQGASATGYYSTTATGTCTVVKPYIGNSLKGAALPTDSIQDTRDNQYYYITEAGNLYWFAENLDYQEKGVAYANSDDVGCVLGRLYTWEEATGGVGGSGLGGGPQGVCPDGWSVPTNEDWEDLAMALNDGNALPFKDKWKNLGSKVMVNATFNADKFWPFSIYTNYENLFGWNALSAGKASDKLHFDGLFSYAYFWSSTPYDGTNAFFRYLYYNSAEFPYGATAINGAALSVRCVKRK